MLLLAQFDGSQSALRTFLPLGFIQALFLLAQAVEAFARLPAHGTQAVIHRKALLTLAFILRLLLRDGVALAGNALAFCLSRVSSQVLRIHPSPWRKHGQAADEPTPFAHVSPVSTTRRSNARNSLDCISLSRETVRGNSWASGPSV